MKRLQLSEITKNFQMNYSAHHSLLAKLYEHMFNKNKQDHIKLTLKSISFSIDSGEIVGLIGSNGAGKSTILRIVAGIYKSDSGKIYSDGKIVSLINLNIGMQERLTLKDNVYLSCAFFGLSSKEISRKFHSIVAFAELGDVIDTQIYKFSEGMKQRLAFSIGIHCNPKILLLDEVFAVGDERFKIKCVNKIIELKNEGVSILLASNDMEIVERWCTRVLWLFNGIILQDGNPSTVVNNYIKK